MAPGRGANADWASFWAGRGYAALSTRTRLSPVADHRTSQLTDAGPMMSDYEPTRDPGVQMQPACWPVTEAEPTIKNAKDSILLTRIGVFLRSLSALCTIAV